MDKGVNTGKKGFTLLEVLIAVLIMGSGLVFLLQALSSGLFTGGINENELVGINLAQEKMELIRNSSYAGVVSEAKAAIPGFSAFSRQVAFTTPITDLKQVTVTVYWFNKATEISTSLVTYVSNL
ncbi:MAG: prepilin-type N-terminal cleavage/methylation domain-containing protein [Candidatus Omnitrophota bacterium]|nr:prepilin-type N-terminal cleavage/methylation domain-containing protein [Candidatus Omnitrophota bacterium]